MSTLEYQISVLQKSNQYHLCDFGNWHFENALFVTVLEKGVPSPGMLMLIQIVCKVLARHVKTLFDTMQQLFL